MSWDLLEADHLVGLDDPARAAALFKRAVSMVEIEVFSYCNRKCWFCPNSSIDRTGENHYMPEAMYASVIGQLASIDYDGTISYSRYNEPLSDEVIYERLAYAHARLPRARLHTNTNGDYLRADTVPRLHAAGLRSLNIQLYLANDERYDHEKTRFRASQTLRRLGLPATVVRDEPGHWHELRVDYPGMEIRLYGRNFEINGTSRGGAVDIHRDYVRSSPCLMPFNAVYIDHGGEMVPCCNLRSDVAAHRDTVIGTLATQPDLFLHYAGRFAAGFRRSLLDASPKQGVCGDCRFALEELSLPRLMKMDVLKLIARTGVQPEPARRRVIPLAAA